MYYQKQWIVQYKDTINGYQGVCQADGQILTFDSLIAAEQYAADKQAAKGFGYFYWTTEWKSKLRGP